MRSLAFLSLPLLVAVACGGSNSSTITDPPSADGGTSSGADGSSGGAYTLDDVCDRTAPMLCALRKSCCEQSHGYDETKCLAQAKAECAADVADVRGGRMTLHGDLIDACITKFKPIFDGCFETIDLLLKAADVADCRIFQGQLDEGARCERDSQCKSGPAGAFVDCNDERQVCTYTRFFKEGEACRYGDNAGGFCTKGLYCDAPLGSNVAGTCKKATPVGSSCDTIKLVSTECGLGAYCDKGTGKCTAAKDEGAACDTAFECKSLQCESGGSGSGRRCQKPEPIVAPNECGK